MTEQELLNPKTNLGLKTAERLPTLPSPKVLWAGNCESPFGDSELGNPARIVRRHRHKRKNEKSPWYMEQEYVLEIARTQDAMGSPLYTPHPMSELPQAFFDSLDRGLPDD